MCGLDPLSIAGMAIGAAQGAATAAGEVSAANKNAAIIIQQTNLEHAAQARERLVEIDAANKEGYQATLEQDRAVAFVTASGEGMGGSTAQARVAEQQRQGALSIANAKDRKEGATVNSLMGGKHSQIAAQHRINTDKPNPLTQFTNIASSGLANYGMFKK
ncbi:virion core protein, T7 gp14 family [Sinorhizobium meliloti]|uniref:virion core protein, T7 gp14 family n=1 Tax=Rhizobium meliloti TaxID=382 RepID=UPI000FD4CAC4|nr:hypothetical protein [Sinorhizobium meliloti]RVJ86948.1 hypothetical protein CN173_30090 [Sinorhizobium meliloti]